MVVAIITAVLVATLLPTHGRSKDNEDLITKSQGSTDQSTNSLAVSYKIAVSLRTKIDRILWITVDPESFARDKISALARQLNKDFPDEPRLYAVIFDSEDAPKHYNPAGGSYDVSEKLVRGKYYLDRPKGQEVIYFSSRRGIPFNETKIVLSNANSPATHRKRAARRLSFSPIPAEVRRVK